MTLIAEAHIEITRDIETGIIELNIKTNKRRQSLPFKLKEQQINTVIAELLKLEKAKIYDFEKPTPSIA